MERLPTEIIIQIAGYLCFHCQNPGLFPHAATKAIRDEKRALAHLCRTSKTICAIAQPVLYHYYASGNLGHAWRSYEKYDYLLQFLRTLLRRPGLALQVTTMQLSQGERCQGPRRRPRRREAAETLSENGWKEVLDELKDKGPRWLECDSTNLKSRKVTLALTLTLRLESLLLAIHDFDRSDLHTESLHLSFPHLHTLGLMCHEFVYHIAELENFYTAAPNLHVMHLGGPGNWVTAKASMI
jgi:hypothetical protein